MQNIITSILRMPNLSFSLLSFCSFVTLAFFDSKNPLGAFFTFHIIIITRKAVNEIVINKNSVRIELKLASVIKETNMPISIKIKLEKVKNDLKICLPKPNPKLRMFITIEKNDFKIKNL